jgi:hypothetical protein
MLDPRVLCRTQRRKQGRYSREASPPHCILTRNPARGNLTRNERCSTSFVGAPVTQVPGHESISACFQPTRHSSIYDRTQERHSLQIRLLAEAFGAHAPKDDAQT